ncbi:MAG: hypothetical protein H6773_00570 [Pseudomonadales bacterium]|nr:hypothetical protein [Candidatus Woesebacteria bacterium]MCB9800655.1 hypothetical protein [Pseudomonadales bacterium]
MSLKYLIESELPIISKVPEDQPNLDKAIQNPDSPEVNVFWFVHRLNSLFMALANSNFSPEQIQFDSLARCISGEDSFENLSLFTDDPKNYDGSSQPTDEFLKENQQNIQDVIAGIEEFSITVTDSGLLANQLKNQYDDRFFQLRVFE